MSQLFKHQSSGKKSRWMIRIRRHLALAALALTAIWVVYLATPPPDARHRLSMGTAYAALMFLVASLWLGPWNILRRQPNPVSFDVRRDVGIWAGALAIFHTIVGLTVHLRGRMWMYFLRKLHPMALQNTPFGFANYTGLVAALLFLMLLLISNNISLRALGIKRWKSAQRWTYLAFAMTLAHGVAYQWIEKRHVPWVILFATFTMMVVVVQIAGFWRKKSALAQVKKLRN